MIRLLFISLFTLASFSLAPAALAGTVPVGGICTVDGDCQPTLACVSGKCTNPPPGAPATGVTLINPLQGGTSLQSFLNNILDFVILIGGIIVMLMLVLVGYKFVVAQGEPGKLTEAKQMLLWTIIGALILIGAKAIAIGITETVKALSVP